MQYISAKIVWNDERAREIARQIDDKILEIRDLYRELEELGYVQIGEAPAQNEGSPN